MPKEECDTCHYEDHPKDETPCRFCIVNYLYDEWNWKENV